MSLIIRDYAPEDCAACIAMFAGNMPQFFAPHELTEFSEFLDERPSDYFVVEQAGIVIGCGGFYTLGEVGGLCWGMVHRDWHRRGIGWMLLTRRLHALRDRGVVLVRLDTTQHSHGFFAKAGFKIMQITEHGYAPGMHRYDMELVLNE